MWLGPRRRKEYGGYGMGMRYRIYGEYGVGMREDMWWVWGKYVVNGYGVEGVLMGMGYVCDGYGVNGEDGVWGGRSIGGYGVCDVVGHKDGIEGM